MANKTIGIHVDDFFTHVGFKTGASLFSKLGIVQVPTKTTIPSAPTLDAFAAPGESSGVLEATVTLPTTNTDGSALVRAEIEDVALYYKGSAGVTTSEPFVIFSARETLPWNPGDLNTWYVKARVRDTHGNWSALSNERSAAAVAPLPESAGLWAHRLGSAAVFTDKDPGASDVAWANVVLYWKDNKYTITAGDTDKKYIWWDHSLSTTTFQVTDTAPTLEQEDCIIGYNDGGTWHLMVYAPMVMANYVRAGLLESTNWGVAAGSQLDLDNGTLKLGGSSDPKFSVDAAGALTSKSGTIAGFTIDATEGLYTGADATRIQMKVGVGLWLGATAFASAPFRVTPAGATTVSNLTVTGGTWGGDTLASAKIPNLDCDKITSGTFGSVRIPELSCDKITTGTFNALRIPSLDCDKITSGTFGTVRIPSLSCSKITSGTFDAVRIPSLDCDKITSGTFDAVRIPNLSASKITTDTMSAARISGGTIGACTISADNITTGSMSAARITTGTLSADRISAGTLNCSLITVSNLSATSINTGTLNFASISRSSLTIISSELGLGSVTYGKIGSNAVRTNELSIDSYLDMNSNQIWECAEIRNGTLLTQHAINLASDYWVGYRSSTDSRLTLTQNASLRGHTDLTLDAQAGGLYLKADAAIRLDFNVDYFTITSAATTGGQWNLGYINVFINGVARSIAVENAH